MVENENGAQAETSLRSAEELRTEISQRGLILEFNYDVCNGRELHTPYFSGLVLSDEEHKKVLYEVNEFRLAGHNESALIYKNAGLTKIKPFVPRTSLPWEYFINYSLTKIADTEEEAIYSALQA